MGENKKNFLITYVVPLLIIASLYCGYMFMVKMETLNKAYSDMNSVEFISSSTQRLISLALTDQLLTKDIFFIGNTTEESLLTTGGSTLSVLDNPSMVLLAETVFDSWNVIEDLVQQDGDMDISILTIYREAHFKAMTDLSNGIKSHSEDLNRSIANYQKMIMFLLSAICVIMLNNILNTHNQLKLSKELAEMAQIDSATSLYNRSKCQELFKNNQSITNKKRPAMIVIDLNDLKKTNDSLGHRVGDELISSFAKALKAACNVNIVQPFIGRYGGDEFIVYYDDIENSEAINVYLKELSFLTEQANQNESRFKLAYAVGYSYVYDTDNEKITIRQLFDKADEIMYENKVAMKRAKNPNYDEQVANGEDVR